jgi:hypothetical protein
VRRDGPLFVTALAAIVSLVAYFIPHALVAGPADVLATTAIVVLACGFVLGGIHLARVNLEAVVRRQEGWPFRLVLLAALVATVATGMVEGPGFATTGMRARWIYDTIYAPLAATILALLAFFVVAAAFRALRVRSVATALLAGSATIVLLGRVPVGAWLTAALPAPFQLPSLTGWLLDVPQTAARRALLMSAALGVIGAGFRILVGIDRPHVGRDSGDDGTPGSEGA